MQTLMFDLDGTLVDRQGTMFGGAAAMAEVRRIRPEPAVIALLTALASRYRIAIVSNGSPAKQRMKLTLSGLAPFVQSLTISGAVGVRKPHRGLFLRACRDAHCRPDEVLMMVGDDPVADMQAAALLGWPTCWVSRGRRWPLSTDPPDCEVTSVLDLPEVLRC